MAYTTIPASTSGATNMGTGAAWTSAQTFLQGKIPQLTGFEYLKIGTYALGTTVGVGVANDGQTEGGAETISGGAARNFGATIYQTPKSGKWGFVMRGKMPVPIAAKVSKVGLINAASTHTLSFNSDQSVDAAKGFLSIVGAGTTSTTPSYTFDTLTHDFAFTGDGTTVKASMLDTILVASTSTLTNLTDEGLAFFISCTDFGAVTANRLLFGYVIP